MKRTSVLSRVTFSLTLFSIVLIAMVSIQVWVGWRVSDVSKQVTEYEMPVALNTLAMLEELGDMNSNMLEYVLGEYEERQEYYSNLDEFVKYRRQIPQSSSFSEDITRVERLVSGGEQTARYAVFERFSPLSEQAAREQINSLVANVGRPLDRLLNELKGEELNDDLPSARYYLELVDEVGDMLTDLDRFLLGDSNAKASFFINAEQFEGFLAKLRLVETRPLELQKITEIKRLFNELKTGGAKVHEEYVVQSKLDALQAIDALEHSSLFEAESLLQKMSSSSRDRVEQSMAELNQLADWVNKVLMITMIGGIALFLTLVIGMRRSILMPVLTIADAINRLRSGERIFPLPKSKDNNEITDIFGSLGEFQKQLTDLDRLREEEIQHKNQLAEETEKAKTALIELQQAQHKLIETEKLASLGALVAGVAHEINSPIGVAVTISSHYKDVADEFVKNVETGVLKRSQLSNFKKETNESLTVLLHALETASTLVANFRQVATDQSSSQRRVFKLNEVIEEVLTTLKHQVKGKDITVSFDGDESIKMDSYPGPLGQVLTNLFNNAILHGFGEQHSGAITIQTYQQNHQVRVIFSDNGCGIPENVRKKVFEPFFTTKLGQGSSGLGLHIVHNIVTGLLGGDIIIKGESGTTVEITLPITAKKNEDLDHE